jgi:hypothetical protein
LSRQKFVAPNLQDIPLAVIVWNAASPGERDATLEFKEAAEPARFALMEIHTL